MEAFEKYILNIPYKFNNDQEDIDFTEINDYIKRVKGKNNNKNQEINEDSDVDVSFDDLG